MIGAWLRTAWCGSSIAILEKIGSDLAGAYCSILVANSGCFRLILALVSCNPIGLLAKTYFFEPQSSAENHL